MGHDLNEYAKQHRLAYMPLNFQNAIARMSEPTRNKPLTDPGKTGFYEAQADFTREVPESSTPSETKHAKIKNVETVRPAATNQISPFFAGSVFLCFALLLYHYEGEFWNSWFHAVQERAVAEESSAQPKVVPLNALVATFAISIILTIAYYLKAASGAVKRLLRFCC